jgi:hypothetical protein
VVRENDIAGEETKNQQHPDRLSLMGSYQYKACNIVTGALEKTLKNQTDFSVGTVEKPSSGHRTNNSQDDIEDNAFSFSVHDLTADETRYQTQHNPGQE